MKGIMTYLSRARLPWIVALCLALAGCKRSEAGDSADSGYATRTSSGDISFEVTPRGVVDGRFAVEIRANTHRGDLADLDLGNIVTLIADGRELKPAQADRLRGHHAAGSIAFQIDSAPARFEIVMRGARDLPEQRFQWP